MTLANISSEMCASVALVLCKLQLKFIFGLLFQAVSSYSWCLCFYCGTPWAFHIINSGKLLHSFRNNYSAE